MAVTQKVYPIKHSGAASLMGNETIAGVSSGAMDLTSFDFLLDDVLFGVDFLAGEVPLAGGGDEGFIFFAGDPPLDLEK